MRHAVAAVVLGALLAHGASGQEAEAPRLAGSEVPVPKRKAFVAPTYPPEAVQQGLRGIVILELVIDTEGRVASVSVVRSVPPFDEAALSAVRQWQYEVTRVDGRAVPVRLTVPITFALRLPDLESSPGIPELRQGATVGYPRDGAGRARVTAAVSLLPDGQVAEAAVEAGDSPWAEAVLGAVRTWRFAPIEGTELLVFKLEARFEPASGAEEARVRLRLFEPRREALEVVQETPASAPPGPAAPPAIETSAPPAAVESPAPPSAAPTPAATVPAAAEAPATEPSAPAPGTTAATEPPASEPPVAEPAPAQPAPPEPAPVPTAPEPAEPETPAPVAAATPSVASPPPSPAGPGPSAPQATAPGAPPPGQEAVPPAAAAPASPAAPIAGPTAEAPAAEPARAGVERAAPGPAAPPVEVLASPTRQPTPTPTPAVPGVSAVRDVALAPGVPDLDSGRRPVAPPWARIQGASGVVEVAFSVDAGGVTSVARVSGPEILREAARQTVESWVFRRTTPERVFLVAGFSYEGDVASARVTPAR